MELREWLLGLLSSGALGYAGFAFVAYLEGKFAKFAHMEAWAKRLVAWAVSAAAGALPYCAMVAMGYDPVPADWRQWIEKLFYYVFIAVSVNQAAHAADKTRDDRLRAAAAASRMCDAHMQDCCDR